MTNAEKQACPDKKAEYLEKRKKYFEKMFGGVDGKDVRKKARRAFYLAHKIRMFEIDLYWRRTVYFWGFQIVIFAAFATLVKENGFLKSYLSPLVAFTGLIMAIAWCYVNKGSKAWQENWEHHVDFLECCFSGNLHKTILGKKESFYSVSKINEYVSIAFICIWFLILVLLFYCGINLPVIFYCKMDFPMMLVFFLIVFWVAINCGAKSKLKNREIIKVPEWEGVECKCTCGQECVDKCLCQPSAEGCQEARAQPSPPPTLSPQP